MNHLLLPIILFVIRGYQLILSPFKGAPSCRFLPTCSDYAKQAFTRHGVTKGGYLTLKRICRCHPWGGHGVDEVP